VNPPLFVNHCECCGAVEERDQVLMDGPEWPKFPAPLDPFQGSTNQFRAALGCLGICYAACRLTAMPELLRKAADFLFHAWSFPG
jgi:hypothetical protein